MIDILKKTALFSGFNDKQLKAIIKLGKREVIEKDSYLFLEEKDAEGVYLVLGGKFIASYNKVDKEYTRGAILSEISLVKKVKHKVNMRAFQKSQVFFLSRKKYEKMKENSPKFALTFQDALLNSFLLKIEKLEEFF